MIATKTFEKQFKSFMPNLLPEPNWVKEARTKYFQNYLDYGFPEAKDPFWKHTDLSLVETFCMQAEKQAFTTIDTDFSAYCFDDKALNVIFVDGHMQSESYSCHASVLRECFAGLLSTNQTLHPVLICSIKEAFLNHESLVRMILQQQIINAKRHPFANLNSALFTDGLFIYLPKNTQLECPVHLLTLSKEKNSLSHLKHIIFLEENSRLTLYDQHQAIADNNLGSANLSFMTNNTMTIILGNNASLHYYKINQPHNGIHLAHTHIIQGRDSYLQYGNFSSGGLFNRDDTTVILQNMNAECKATGFYRLQQDQQYRDHHFDIIHAASHTKSEMIYKGILDKQSKAVFNGRLNISADCQKITAQQANHNLLLAKSAQVYSKPDLEIYADDVQCKHAATIGQLNEEAIFYLRARGIPKQEAINLLLQGFAEELITATNNPELCQHLRQMVQS